MRAHERRKEEEKEIRDVVLDFLLRLQGVKEEFCYGPGVLIGTVRRRPAKLCSIMEVTEPPRAEWAVQIRSNGLGTF